MQNWFALHFITQFAINNCSLTVHPAILIFQYLSQGSFSLGVLGVEGQAVSHQRYGVVGL